jgi:undecaprenyl-diphosphatase
VEFSFLLGLLTLAAATVFEAVQHGGELIDTFGWVNPLIGFVAAFVTAVIAIRWMVSYLQRHSLELFGWYRIVVAAIALVLLATGVL